MNNENSTDILSESGGNGGGDSPSATEKDKGADSFNPLRFLRRIQNRIARSPSSYLAYAFIIPAIIMLLVYICMELHPFGDGSVLVLDLNAQYVYFFEALRNFVRGDAELLYSFSRALGGEFMGIYAYYLASPLSYIVALFPTERMLEAMLVLILTKTGLCGFTFGFYLHRHSEHPNKLAVIAFSSMYALSAYAVVYQSNVMWTDALIWLPIICYSIEQLIKFRRYKLFVISLSVAVMSNFYIGYMLCIFVAVYFFYYFIAYNDGRNNPLGEKSHFLRSLLRIGVFSAIAVAISAVIIMTAYYSLTFGKTTFSDPNWAFSENFKPIDFLTKFLPGSYDTVRPEGLPFVYCGTLALMLLPVYFMAKNIPSREKIASVVLIMFFVISFMASPLDLIWHGFQRPNWLNYRYSFMLVFILLVLAYKGFGNLRHIGEKFLLGVSAIIVLFAAVCQKLEFESYVESDSKLLSLETVWFTVIAVTCFLVLLCLLIRIKNVKKRENVCGVLAALVCVELFCSSLACVVQYDKDVAYSRYSGYNNFLSELRPIVETVNENDPSFYRMEKNAHRKVNDNMALGIKGLTNSTSTLNSSVIEFLNRMGYASKSHWSKYLGGTPVNDSLLGIKYIIDTDNSEKMLEYYDEAYTSGKYSAYLNPYALPLAYGVDSSVLEYDMSREKSHFERLNALVGSMLGTDDAEIFKSIKTEDTELYNCEKSSVANHIKYSVKDTDVSATITYTITAVSDGEIFMFIPSDYTREAKLSVNGSSHDTVFAKESDRIISLGIFEAGESVKVKITINNTNNNFYTGTGCDYFYYIDMDAFKDAFGRLTDNPGFVINDDYTDTHLSGTISTADSNCTILTTVPYDEGWHIILDGEEIAYDKALDCLITFEIGEAGEHTLEFKYMPSAFVSGIRITMIGIAVFVIICVAEFIFRRIIRKRRTMPESARDIPWELDDFDEDYEQYKLCAPDAPAKKPKEIISVSLSAVSDFFAGNKKGKKEADKSEPDENSEVCTDSKTDIDEENLPREGEERISPDGSENQNEGNDNDENKENGDN